MQLLEYLTTSVHKTVHLSLGIILLKSGGEPRHSRGLPSLQTRHGCDERFRRFHCRYRSAVYRSLLRQRSMEHLRTIPGGGRHRPWLRSWWVNPVQLHEPIRLALEDESPHKIKCPHFIYTFSINIVATSRILDILEDNLLVDNGLSPRSSLSHLKTPLAMRRVDGERRMGKSHGGHTIAGHILNLPVIILSQITRLDPLEHELGIFRSIMSHYSKMVLARNSILKMFIGHGPTARACVRAIILYFEDTARRGGELLGGSEGGNGFTPVGCVHVVKRKDTR
mmetsp:Transcript_30626/g.55521  ORF Transcript_30626/g.55521 Transcript_30626/m.55521 type:complete len:281 (-) Transcript_30626:2183-3025(-)